MNNLVSVIIPTHNRPVMLKLALESVLNQTYKNIEVIVIDDGIEMRAKDVISSFNDNRIVYFQNEKSLGSAISRNIGIKKATGEYIAFLDDDDQWMPNKLEKQIEMFSKTPNDVGYSFTSVINEFDDHEETTIVPNGIADYHSQIVDGMRTLTVTLVIKKEVFDKVGMFDEDFPNHQEMELMFRVSKEYKGLAINEPLTRVSMRTNYARVTNASIERRIKGREMLIEKHFDDFKKYPRSLANHYFRLGLWNRDLRNYKQAQQYFKKAWKAHFRFRYVLHWKLMLFKGVIYKLRN